MRGEITKDQATVLHERLKSTETVRSSPSKTQDKENRVAEFT